VVSTTSTPSVVTRTGALSWLRFTYVFWRTGPLIDVTEQVHAGLTAGGGGTQCTIFEMYTTKVAYSLLL
jgi:hypothetical protein